MITNFNQFINESVQLEGGNNKIISLLEDALCEEYNAWYAYTVIKPFLVGLERTEVEEVYGTNGSDELNDHADWLINRINELGGDATKFISPDTWNKVATHKYIKPTSNVVESLKQNIEAEKGAIETYTNIERETRDVDVVTNQKVKAILADEQQHLISLEELLDDIQSK